ncbi:Tensin-1 [Eumeta japonica]|uniref:Tensin-1 n=1 Tax=Eumeta variegata TaxID=151549 RepID=A0A4C1SMK6_EUMVA|nr:Tensin-1 [Eumeta japonica]
MLDIYSSPYDERFGLYKQRSNSVQQPLEATSSTAATKTTLQRTQRSTDFTAYGNGNMFDHEHTNHGQTMTDRESSPIYATSTKKVTSSSAQSVAAALTSPAYRNGNNAILTTTSSLTVADYPSPNMGRPETPAFPVTPRTPFAGGHSNGYASQANTFNKQQHQLYQPTNAANNAVEHNYSTETIYGTNYRPRLNSSLSMANSEPQEVAAHLAFPHRTNYARCTPKGCANEPVFTSLSALVYEHSINQLALPCLLNIPERDLVPPLVEHTPAQKQLLTQGAACNVLWLFSSDTESLTGEEAIRKAIRQMYALPALPTPTEVHFTVTQQGITLTDNTRKKFFRKHYTADIISYCAIDPDHRLWTMQEHGNDNTTVVGALKKTIFAFVARRSPSSKDNQCHVFCDLAINQPASAIVSFVNKTLPRRAKNYVL